MWLETIPSIRLRVFVTARKEERGRRNSAALSGKMCFSVTMAFSVHNLSHKGPVGNVFVSPSNWQGTKSIMTYCWTRLYSVSHVHVLSPPRPSGKGEHTRWRRAKQKKKKKGAVTDVWQTIDQSRGTFWTPLFVFWMHHSFEWLPFVLKILWDIDKKKKRKKKQCVTPNLCQSSRSLFLIH